MTTQDVYLKIIHRISPYSKDGVEITSANLGDEQPDRFTRARVVDIYQEARTAMFQALLTGSDWNMTLKEFINTPQVTPLSGSTITKPDDFVFAVSITDGDVLYRIVPAAMEDVIKSERYLAYTSTTERRFAVDRGTSIRVYPDLVDGDMKYMSFNTTTEAGVIAGDVDERFNITFIPSIIELAEFIADGHSQNDIGALARRLAGTGEQ